MTKWQRAPDQPLRLAGVSSFGFSGSNAHVVLEEYLDKTEIDSESPASGPALATVAARSEEALKTLCANLAGRLESNDCGTLPDICQTLAEGRTHPACRRAWVVQSKADLVEQLLLEQGRSAPMIPEPARVSSLCFLFTGQGSERTGMGLDLLARSEVFRRSIERLDHAAAGLLDCSIQSIWSNHSSQLAHARYVQPALYAYGWALSELWRSFGLEPQAVLGHSLGEYVAATVAGVMRPEDGMRLVIARGRLTEELAAPSAMIAVSASAEQVRRLFADPRWQDALSIAAINGRNRVVVSGAIEAIAWLEDRLRSESLRSKRLSTTHGFHSSSLDPMLDAFEAEAARIDYQPAQMRWVSNLPSNLDGRPIDSRRPIDAQYWRRQLRQTVHFSDCLTSVEALSPTYLEIGAEPQLLALAEDHGIPRDRLVSSIRKSGSPGEWHKTLSAAAELYARGFDLDWKGIHQQRRFQKVALPGYPFERKRFWFSDSEAVPKQIVEQVSQALLAQSAMVPIGLDVARINERQTAINNWATAFIFATLDGLGGFPSGAGIALSSDTVIQQHGVVPVHRRLIDRWLQRLANAGILQPMALNGQLTYTLLDRRALPSAEALWAGAERLLSGDQPLRNYLTNCASLLRRVLLGEVNALETLFPHGSNELATALYERSPGSIYANQMAAAAIARRAASGAKTAMGFSRRLRVLELGAGTGATTAAVLAQLSPEQVIYTYSDVSESFLVRARQRFRSHPMEFLLFDLDCEDHALLHQARYDVVLIANALHAAKHLGRSLDRVRRILQPGGLVVLIETTQPQAWHDVSTGLIEGWQHFEDGLRSESPLLSVDQWQEELARHGFRPAVAAPQADQPTHVLGMHVLVAQSPLHPDRQQPGAGDEVSVARIPSPFATTGSIGARAPLPAVDLDVVDLNAIDPCSHTGASVAHFREAIEVAPPAQRLELLLDCTQVAVAETLGRESLPRRDDRLMDLGLDSLMAIELRNRLQQALALNDLPSTLIFDYPTCASIATFLLIKLGFVDSPHPNLDFPQSGDFKTLHNHAAIEHSEAELDNMSSEQIAELLRMQLES